MLQSRCPHFLLFSEAWLDGGQGNWRFVLAPVGAGESLSASDFEQEARQERLELLAVVRGLEALDQPARVTLVTNSRYVNRGLKHGLADWRASDWQWERFGQLVPVRHADLWRRVDRALAFHDLDCRLWRFQAQAEPQSASPANADDYPVTKHPRPARRSQAAWAGQRPSPALAAG
jgi:ribonuclease HI